MARPPYLQVGHAVRDGGSPGREAAADAPRELEAVRDRTRVELERLVQERTAQLQAAIARLTAEVEERRRAEAAALRYQRALSTVSQVNAAIVRAPDESALIEACCRIAVDRGGYRLAWVGFAEHDARRRVRPVARAGRDVAYLDGIDVTWADDERGRGPVGTAVRTGTPTVARNLAHDDRFAPWRHAALRLGFGAMIALPLRAENVTLGALAIYGEDADAFDGSAETPLVELADHIAFGIMALRGRAQRAEMRAQLMQADRLVAMGTLAAGVAHEINNPLAYVLAGLEFASEELDASRGAPSAAGLDEVRQALRDVREGGRRIRDVVRDLKVFSRGDDGQHGPVDLRRVLEATLQMASNEIRHRASLVKELGAVPDVDANDSRLGQVFLNLLINAAHAIAPGAADEHRITVRTRTDEQGRAVVEVSDTGTGMTPETLERIFEPFFTTKPVGVGTGLGLAICRNIVTSLGGQIGVASAPGRGSTFTVVLPACTDLRTEPAPEPRRSRGRVRVLAIDDEPLVLKAIKRMLAGQDVVIETSAQAALARLQGGERYDVVLCDLMMPQMTGVDFHAAVSASWPDVAARIVFLTGGAFTPATKTFLDGVPNPRLEKPFDRDALGRLVTSAA